MSHPVTIENDALKMEVWPSVGGKVSSLIDKADRFELLFNYPAELPTRPLYDVPFSEGWYGGWDECFPAVAPGPYVGHPYNAVNVPDHGELWGLPTVSTPTRHGITTVWHGMRFAYRLTRQLELDGASLVARYTLNNLAPFPFRFVWAMHALMSMSASVPVEIELANDAPMRLSHDAGGHDLNKAFAWPKYSDECDFSKPQSLPPGRGWKLFSAQPIASPAVVRYPTRNRRLEVMFESAAATAEGSGVTPTSASIEEAEDSLTGAQSPTQAYWGVWINTGGWVRHHHFAIEPTTGRYDQIDRSQKDNSAARVGPNASIAWTVTLRVS
jgi:hypothetical protein